MDLFSQMLNFVRAQQVLAFSNCIVTNDYDHIPFLSKKGFVSNSFNEHKDVQQFAHLTENITNTHFLLSKPTYVKNIPDYYMLNEYITDFADALQMLQKNSNFIIDYNTFIGLLNKENETC